ncbi:MAG: hypothetical protein ABI592_08685 [Acidobacteriota bacterium]
MPESARLLKFPSRLAQASFSAEDSRFAAENLLSIPLENRTDENWGALELGDVSMAVLDQLRKDLNSAPKRIQAEASALFERLKAATSVGLFDERDYFLGEAALLAGTTSRLIGCFEDAENWFDLADISFRHTVNSAPLLNRVSHARLVLRYEMRRFTHVLALLPSVIAEYDRLGMVGDSNKAKFLHGLIFKELGNGDRSLECLLSLRASFGPEDPSFRSLVHTNIAEAYARRGEDEKSLTEYQAALAAIESTGDHLASQGLKASLGEAYRVRGNYAEAIKCLRSAVGDATSLRMQTRIAYLRVLLAEALLAAGRDREAEWEILAALPTIEEQQMAVEGVAAIELLRRSVTLKNTDRQALSRLRQHLKEN